MPRTPSHVWIHFTTANVEGKAVYTKCPKFPQGSKQTTPGKSSSASIRSENDSDSDTFSTAHSHSGIRGFFDSMDDHSQRNVDECFARAMYATGSPLMLTANVYWKRFLNVLRPAYTPPTRHALSTHLLDTEFNRVQARKPLTKQIAFRSSMMGGRMSGGQGIINYIVTTPQPVFYKSTDTKDNRHTGLYIDELKAVISDLGTKKVFGLVTDNAPNMKVTWEHVAETYPHITNGCAAHTLNLLLKDIMALKTMDTLYKTAKQVVKYVKGKQVASAIYFSKRKEKKQEHHTEAPQHHSMGWGCHHV
ncbi:glucose-fructose oxidoreductase domain-containing protein 2 isoform X1 [Tachysurus ichikawai]